MTENRSRIQKDHYLDLTLYFSRKFIPIFSSLIDIIPSKGANKYKKKNIFLNKVNRLDVVTKWICRNKISEERERERVDKVSQGRNYDNRVRGEK